MNDLIDRFGRVHTYLRISVTDRCNLRCRYCMPPEGIKIKSRAEILSFDEIARMARIFVDMGVRKIRLTGGEPLVRNGIEDLISELGSIPQLQTLAMTTNAVLLADKIEMLKERRLSALNISLDSLSPRRFREITLRDDHHLVMSAIEKALRLNFDSLKINVVAMAGVNDDELVDFIEYFKDYDVNVRFIEYMPFKGNGWQPERLMSYAEMRRIIEDRFELSPLPVQPGAVAKDFAVAGASMTVSFITSMTDSFCSTCNRLRLTSEGGIKSCLFYAPEINVRDVMRDGCSDQDLRKLIQEAVLGKPEAHPPVAELVSADNRSMVEIGG